MCLVKCGIQLFLVNALKVRNGLVISSHISWRMQFLLEYTSSGGHILFLVRQVINIIWMLPNHIQNTWVFVHVVKQNCLYPVRGAIIYRIDIVSHKPITNTCIRCYKRCSYNLCHLKSRPISAYICFINHFREPPHHESWHQWYTTRSSAWLVPSQVDLSV